MQHCASGGKSGHQKGALCVVAALPIAGVELTNEMLMSIAKQHERHLFSVDFRILFACFNISLHGLNLHQWCCLPYWVSCADST